MELPHGWLLRHGFNLCCEVHSCHLMRCEIPCQSTFCLAALHVWGCKSIMCNVRIDCSSSAKPLAQAHFPHIHENAWNKIKIKKKKQPYFYLYLNIIFLFLQWLLLFTWNLSLPRSWNSQMWPCLWTLWSGYMSVIPGGTRWHSASWMCPVFY